MLELKSLDQVIPVLVVSHPRSGTHLLLDSLRRNIPACNAWKWPWQPLSRVYLSIESLYIPMGVTTTSREAVRIVNRADRPLLKTHVLPSDLPVEVVLSDGSGLRQWKEWIDEKAIKLYSYRDGRDVIMSYQRWRAGFDPEARCSVSEFLRKPISGMTPAAYWAKHVRRGLKSDMLPIQYESVIDNPKAIIPQLSKLINSPCSLQDPILPKREKLNRFRRITRRLSFRPRNTIVDGRSHGSPDKWYHVFTSEDKRIFEAETEGLLVELGYEHSSDWVLQ